MLYAICSVLLVMAPPVKGAVPQNNDEPYRIAKEYLDALVGKGDQKVRELMLGGMTWMAQTVSIDNYKIKERDPTRLEKGRLDEVAKFIHDIDRAGKIAMDKMLGVSEKKTGSEGEVVGEVTSEQAKKLMAPAKGLMDKFTKKYPVFAWVARVDKDVYWHPKNPIRPLLKQAGGGNYTLEVHRFLVETTDPRLNKSRVIKVRILRLQSDAGFDTGWKILPAAEWNPEE